MTLAYYISGFILAWLTYMMFGWEYMHAPGLHHFIGFLFLLGGAVWILYYLGLLLIGKKEKINLGTLTIHLLAIISVVTFIVFSVYQQNKKSIQTDTRDVITIDTDTTGKPILTNGIGDTLDVEEGDSVLINKIDKK